MSMQLRPLEQFKPPSRYREDAPACRAILFVMPGHYGVMHDHIGELLDHEIDALGEREVVDALCQGVGPGCFMWEGTIQYVRVGPYDCDDTEAEYVGSYRRLTEAEAKAVADGEDAWDVSEWVTADAVADDARRSLAVRAAVTAQFTLTDQCRALLAPPVSEDAVAFRWYLDQLGRIEHAVQALVRAEADRDDG